jgi:hypothetical protein
VLLLRHGRSPVKFGKTFLAATVLALLMPGCSGTQKTGGRKLYRPWCNTEKRFLGPWGPSKEEAKALVDSHLQRWGWHATRINERTVHDENS